MVAWSTVNIPSHREAYDKAKRDFIECNERDPQTNADFSAILRRAEAIRRGEL